MEAEASQPAEQITIGNSVIDVTKDEGGNIIKASGNITLDKLKELAEKSTNNIVINTNALTIKSFNDKGIIEVKENDLQAVINKLSVLNIENQDFTKQSITLNIENNKLKITSVTGNISLKDITENSNEETTEIAKYIAKKLKENSDTNFDSSNLTINTFYKTKKRGAPSRDSSQTNPEYTYESTPITPKFLKETELNALNKAVLNFKDGGISIDVSFASHQGETEEQKQKDYFDITEFYNEIENGKLKNIKNIPADKVKGNIFLRGERTNPYPESTEDETDYPKASELVKLIENPKLKDNIIVGSVQIAGKLNKLLPLLANGTIKEKTPNSIIFGNANIIPCSGPLWTGFNGWISDTQKESVLKIDELKELCKRTKGHAVYIRNAIIENLDSKDNNQIQDIIFLDSKLTNVNFKNSDLSKINFEYCSTGGGYLKFENSTLPETMKQSAINHLILKNSRLPENLDSVAYFSSSLTSLRIYNENKNDFFGSVETTIYGINGPPPEKYIGPIELWKNIKDEEGNIVKRRLEFIYNKKGYDPRKVYFTEQDLTDINLNLDEIPFEDYDPEKNYTNHASIKKPQSLFLALLQNQGKSRG